MKEPNRRQCRAGPLVGRKEDSLAAEEAPAGRGRRALTAGAGGGGASLAAGKAPPGMGRAASEGGQSRAHAQERHGEK